MDCRRHKCNNSQSSPNQRGVHPPVHVDQPHIGRSRLPASSPSGDFQGSRDTCTSLYIVQHLLVGEPVAVGIVVCLGPGCADRRHPGSRLPPVAKGAETHVRHHGASLTRDDIHAAIILPRLDQLLHCNLASFSSTLLKEGNKIYSFR